MLHKCYNVTGCAIFIAISHLLSACATSPKSLSNWVENSPLTTSTLSISGLPVALAQSSYFNDAEQLHIYIEGDGTAFSAQGLPSLDPTPRHPIALQLALADTSGAGALYLGRPCQWVDVSHHPACTPAVWTTQRFTPEILQGYTQTITTLAAGRPVRLIGYSGGAWLAYGVAQSLPNTREVVSVAGNLDPNLVNRHHRVPELEVAPWPKPENRLAVLMLVGDDDFVIPPKLAAQMKDSLLNACTAFMDIPNATHTKGYLDNWPKFIKNNPCTGYK